MLLVLTIEMLCQSLIQKAAFMLLISTPQYLSLSIYEQPCNELDRKIPESPEDVLVILWNGSTSSKLLVSLLPFPPIFKQLN